jgi:hypothetical protein
MIQDTAAALDRAMARIAVSVAGTPERATELLANVGKGEQDRFAGAFMSQAAALMRARLLLADAARPPNCLRKRAAA